MKIGIITLPFNTNYGGILQAYALQWVLKKQGHEVLTINRNTRGMPLKMKILSFTKRAVQRYLMGKNVIVRTWPLKNEAEVIGQHTNRFIAENIEITPLFSSESAFKNLKEFGFDAYIVGSDQVWRPKYSPNLENHFLDFAENEPEIIRIAYAASFGVDAWEFTPEQTKTCSKLAKMFDAISVREDSAVHLCQQYLGVDAVQVPDPTLLVPKEHYIKLVEKDNIKPLDGNLTVYVLDLTVEKKQLINRVADELGLKPVSTMPALSFKEAGKNHIEKATFPPLTNWIRGFMDAEFVVTDSFHGTVFSIIFNKPFVAVGNTKRGMSRFQSLFKMFGLEERLIEPDAGNLLEIINKPIDFKHINEIIKQKQADAFAFLDLALKK